MFNFLNDYYPIILYISTDFPLLFCFFTHITQFTFFISISLSCRKIIIIFLLHSMTWRYGTRYVNKPQDTFCHLSLVTFFINLHDQVDSAVDEQRHFFLLHEHVSPAYNIESFKLVQLFLISSWELTFIHFYSSSFIQSVRHKYWPWQIPKE